LVLTGQVASKSTGERIAALASTTSKNVVNMLQARDGRDAVLLQVRFAEVDRAAILQLGANFFSTGAGNTIGAISTQQFGPLSGNIGATPGNLQRPQAPSTVGGAVGANGRGTPAIFGLSDLLNVFLFNPDINLGVTIKALQEKNLLEMLAEPNVLA